MLLERAAEFYRWGKRTGLKVRQALEEILGGPNALATAGPFLQGSGSYWLIEEAVNRFMFWRTMAWLYEGGGEPQDVIEPILKAILHSRGAPLDEDLIEELARTSGESLEERVEV